MAAVAGAFAIERIAGEAIAVFAARIVALAGNAGVDLDANAVITRCEYDVPTFSFETTGAPGAGAALVVVALDRNPGEAIGAGVGVAADVGFCGRIRAVLAAIGNMDTSTCFINGVAALPPVLLYDPPTFMFLYTAAAGARVLEAQGVDNDANTVEALPVPKVAPGAWTTALLWTVTTKAGHTIFIGN